MTTANEAHYDQLFAAMGEATDLAWMNAHLVTEHRIEELIFEAQRRFKNDENTVGVRVVRAWMPGYDGSHWMESTMGEPRLSYGFSDEGCPPEEAKIPAHGTCVWHNYYDPVKNQMVYVVGPVKVLWVPAPPLLVQFAFCHDCAAELEREFGTLDWRQPDVTL